MAKPKPAYLVASSFMREGHGSLEAYGRATHPLLEKYGGELLVAGAPDQFMDHYEGNWNKGARFTLFRFPSMEALQSFWRSEEYQSVKHLRTDVTAAEMASCERKPGQAPAHGRYPSELHLRGRGDSIRPNWRERTRIIPTSARIRSRGTAGWGAGRTMPPVPTADVRIARRRGPVGPPGSASSRLDGANRSGYAA